MLDSPLELRLWLYYSVFARRIFVVEGDWLSVWDGSNAT